MSKYVAKANRELKQVDLIVPERKADSALTLFCFPYAGAGASAFHAWKGQFAGVTKLVFVQYPGRESCMSAPLCTDMDRLIKLLADRIVDEIGRPYAFYGHSLGALVSYELACFLRTQGVNEPKQLFLSGMVGPQYVQHQMVNMHKYVGGFDSANKSSLMRMLGNLNGTPKEILSDPNLLKYILPIIQSDINMIAQYRHRKRTSLTIPITLFSGDKDSLVNTDEMNGWKEITKSTVIHRKYNGSHFFIKDQEKDFIHDLQRELLSLSVQCKEQ